MYFIKLILLGFFTLGFLTACYHPDIQQGNVWDQKTEQQLKSGMSKQQVKTILGDSILTDPFDNNQLIYVYTNYPTKGDYSERKLILTFKNDKLIHIDQSTANSK